MGNNHSTNIHAEALHTELFLDLVREVADNDIQEVPDPETRTQIWQDFVTSCFYLAANLRCQWFMKRPPVKPEGEESWCGGPIQSVHDGVYATLLVYASRGMSIGTLLHLPHIQEEMEKRGLPSGVHIDIVLKARSRALYGLNDWLLAELDLKDVLAPTFTSLENGAKLCHRLVHWADERIDEEYRDNGLTLNLLKRALVYAANMCFPGDIATAERYYLDLDDVTRQDLRNLFYRHYQILSGGRDYAIEANTNSRHRHCRFAGVAAAVFCSIVLARGIVVGDLEADPLFSVPGQEDDDDSDSTASEGGWKPARTLPHNSVEE